MQVHLIDGTYELFRYHFGKNSSHVNAAGLEVGATRGVVGSCLALLEGGATHIGVATDHVIESFRNELWPGYKTSDGMPPELLAQFDLVEDALRAAGFVVWPMVEFEADDALGAAAVVCAADPTVDQVVICTPDKDLGQCVVGDRIVQLDRRQEIWRNADGVVEKFGVPPESIPDYLALVGDSADGFPGLPGWGAKSAAAVLARYGHLEDVPASADDWDVAVRGAAKLASALNEQRELALLFRTIATIRTDAPTVASADELRWSGPTAALPAIAAVLEAPALLERATALAARRP